MEICVYLCLCFAPLIIYLGMMLLWSVPERICPRSYPVKPICTTLSCVRCSRNIISLKRAKTFVENGLLFSSKKIKNAISNSINVENELLFRMPGLSSRSIWTSNHWKSNIAKDIQKLEENHTTIKLACLQVLKNASMWQRKDDASSGGNWFIYPLLKNGLWCDDYCNLESELMEIIHSLISTMHKCAFGNIYFSLLPPKTKIQSHRGPTNIRLKCHLALEVPKDNESCFLTVSDEKIYWEEGKCLVFDDSLPHSATSNSLKEDRIALILDFWHPSLSTSEKRIIRRAFPQTE
jgi:hypothetical protein